MGKPWEKYQQAPASPKPWEKYAPSQDAAAKRQHDLYTLPGTETLPTEDEMNDAQAKAYQRLLQYPVGIVTTGLASAASLGKQAAGPALDQLRQGNLKSAFKELGKNVVTSQEAKNALNPFSPEGAPPAGELAQRLGIPTGPHLSDVAPSLYSEPGSGGIFSLQAPERGGPLDITPRGTAITGLEMATDPLNRLLPKPVKSGLEAGGKSIYRSGLKAADIAAENVGKGTHAASDLFWKEGVSGTPKQFAKQSNNIAERLLGERGALMEQAHQLGARPNMENAVAPAEALLKKMQMSGDPATRELIPTLQAKLAEYKNISPADLAAQSQWKTSLYDALPTSAWANVTKTTPGRTFQKTLARGLKEDIETQANKLGRSGIPANEPVYMSTNPQGLNLGDQIAGKNADLGVLLSTQKTLDKEAAKSINKNFLTSVDPIVMGIGEIAGNMPKVVAAKKTADVLKGTYARTKLGKGLYNLGKIPIDPFIRQESVWRALNQQNQGEE